MACRPYGPSEVSLWTSCGRRSSCRVTPTLSLLSRPVPLLPAPCRVTDPSTPPLPPLRSLSGPPVISPAPPRSGPRAHGQYDGKTCGSGNFPRAHSWCPSYTFEDPRTTGDITRPAPTFVLLGTLSYVRAGLPYPPSQSVPTPLFLVSLSVPSRHPCDSPHLHPSVPPLSLTRDRRPLSLLLVYMGQITSWT